MDKTPAPARDATRPAAQPCTIVIFGATGDLTHRKLIPAIYNLAADGDLPEGTSVVGFARREKTDEEFRVELEEAARKFSRQKIDDTLWTKFAQGLHYHRSEFSDVEGYKALAARLDKVDEAHGSKGNRLFYLAAGPDQFESILINLREAGLNVAKPGSWSRVVVEKPFGTDFDSAHHLNEVVSASFHEQDTFRIDHYLGKETAQNIMVLRFANAIWEGLWNHRYIDHVQITAAEPLGVEGRGGYYEGAGALRDMVQNHLLQLLSLVAMEPPVDLSADAIRDEKVKVIRSLRPFSSVEQVAKNTIRGQYSAGAINGARVKAYRDEERVNPESNTETFVALRLFVDNWRWADVPFYVRAGKRLQKGGTEIAIQFKKAPPVLFNKATDGFDQNVLVIRIQPDEGISFRMAAKVPGAAVRIERVKMDFQYKDTFGKASPEAYERLLLDSMAGDATLFARRDEVEFAWKFIDEIEKAWASDDDAVPLCYYVSGSWGPNESEDMLRSDDRCWRKL